MRERKIFLNIAHVPKIWGVPYPKAVASVGLLLFSTVLGNAVSRGAGTIVKILVVIVAVVLAAALHGFFILLEHRDILEQEVTFVKDHLNSQSSSLQTVKLLPKGLRNKGKKQK